MNLEIPKLTGRIYKPIDVYGWFMSILGLVLMTHFGGLLNSPPNWWALAFTVFIFFDYAVRVACGRVYKFVYYDTIIHPMYKLNVKGKDQPYYVNAESEDELNLYMELHYPNVEYSIDEVTHTETFIKTERFV